MVLLLIIKVLVMANNVTNRLEFYGDSEMIKELKEFIKGDEDVIDFEKIIPRDEFLVKWYNAPKGDDPESILVRDRLKNEFNCKSGHDWTNNNWGTKWNAYDQYDVYDDIIEFHTAWSSPDPIIEAISKKYPEIEISVMYADESIGENAGTYTIINGEITEMSDDNIETTYDIYFETNGDSTECLIDSIVYLVEEDKFNDSLVAYVVNKLNLAENYQSILDGVNCDYKDVVNSLYNHFILKTKLKAFLSDEKE